MLELRAAFQGIFEDALLQEMEEVCKLKTYQAGDVLIDFGATIKAMPILLTGVIKILREDFDAGELLLYFLEKGDSCALSIDCCIGHKTSEIRAQADSLTRVAFVPNYYIDQWMVKYPSWRNFILASYSNRFEELLSALDNIAFLQMDVRILNYLKEQQKLRGTDLLQITHQEIANDLNTSRVVVSRLLKSLENQAYISLQRNNIHMLKK